MNYVQISLKEDSIAKLKTLTSFIKDEDYYYSNLIPRISGNVTSKAHLTLYYGFETAKIDVSKLQLLFNTITIDSLNIESFELFEGYQNQYKILVLKVNDDSGELENLSRQIKNIVDPTNLARYEFKPHITLAYVTNDFIIPKDNLTIKEVLIQTIEVK